MKSLAILIKRKLDQNFTHKQAKDYVCQEIILSKIYNSPFSEKVLLKGGVVIFNLTRNLRRTTSDLDFDFIRYSISNKSIVEFIRLLDKAKPNYRVQLVSMTPLHQDDYKGKRVIVKINDFSSSVVFKLDIGVHNLFAIRQDYMCFSFGGGKEITLKVNPPEQIFAEKLCSLTRHRELSTRYKDVFDLYYFIENKMLSKTLLKKCIEIVVFAPNKLKTIEDVYESLEQTFKNKIFIEGILQSSDRWLDVKYEDIFKSILDFIYSL